MGSGKGPLGAPGRPNGRPIGGPFGVILEPRNVRITMRFTMRSGGSVVVGGVVRGFRDPPPQLARGNPRAKALIPFKLEDPLGL